VDGQPEPVSDLDPDAGRKANAPGAATLVATGSLSGMTPLPVIARQGGAGTSGCSVLWQIPAVVAPSPFNGGRRARSTGFNTKLAKATLPRHAFTGTL